MNQGYHHLRKLRPFLNLKRFTDLHPLKEGDREFLKLLSTNIASIFCDFSSKPSPKVLVFIYMGYCPGKKNVPKLLRNIWSLPLSQQYSKTKGPLEIKLLVEFWGKRERVGLFFFQRENIHNIRGEEWKIMMRFHSNNSTSSPITEFFPYPHLSVQTLHPWSEHASYLFSPLCLINSSLSITFRLQVALFS